jgi:hypothetical protein
VSEELRDLERAAAGGGALERLALAGALERLGRGDEAREALVPARADPDVRRELARFPAWTHAHADAGASNFLDVEPIRTKPRVRWSRPVRGTPQTLVASAAVVIASVGRSVALDAETGATLWDSEEHVLALAADVALTRARRSVVARDSWTGALLHEVEVPKGALVDADARGITALVENEVLAFAFDDARRPPVSERRTQVRLESLPRCFLSRDRVVVVGQRASTILERGALAPIARIDGRAERLDARVVIAYDVVRLACHDAVTGARLWTREGPLFARGSTALGPSHVWSDLFLLDVRTGADRGERPVESGAIVVRDVAYGLRERTALAAHSLEGRELWRLTEPELPTLPFALAAQPRRLYGSGRNTVFCLEAPT